MSGFLSCEQTVAKTFDDVAHCQIVTKEEW
jgi:hypothetical protein